MRPIRFIVTLLLLLLFPVIFKSQSLQWYDSISYGELNNVAANEAFILKTDTVVLPFVQELTENSFYNVHPNPSSGVFNISCNGNDKFDLKIFNAFGQLIYNERSAFKTSIDLNKESRGVYYLEIVQNGKKTTRKLVLD